MISIKKYIFSIASIAIIYALFWGLSSNYSERFTSVETSYINKTAVNLTQAAKAESISNILQVQGYLPAAADADFAAAQLEYKLGSGLKLSTLYDLDKRIWQVSSSTIDSIGSDFYKDKLSLSRESLGVDSEYYALDIAAIPTTEKAKGNSSEKITVSVYYEDDSANFIAQKLNKNRVAAPGVIVRLSEHYLDSLASPIQQIVSHAKTNDRGVATFEGLNPKSTYSVLPIQEGYEYGSSKGTTQGDCTLESCTNPNFSFVQIEHKIRLFDAATLRQIKEDTTMTIRSPKEFKSILVKDLALFFVFWWSCLFLCRRKKANSGILYILILLTGLSLLTMFSINDPLLDKLLGEDMATGILAGIAIIGALQYVDFTKLYQDRLALGFDIPLECFKWLFKPYPEKILYLTATMKDKSSSWRPLAAIGALVCTPFLILDVIGVSKCSKKLDSYLDSLPKGSGYLFTALLLTILLFTPLGKDVGGMKVNLDLGILFQPSEIAKYLLIFFMAAFFCQNADRIVKYSQEGNVGLFGHKFKMMLGIIAGLSILMILYFRLGDMGPALVLGVTFIILYSIVKSKIELENLSNNRQLKNILTCDLAMLIYGVVTFVLFLYFGGKLGNMGIFCLMWFGVWIIVGLSRKQIFESAIFLNLIVAMFIFGGTLLQHVPGAESVGKRLESRNEMCTNTWGTLPVGGLEANAGENTQVADGLWSIASGGLTGQGLGNGSPHYTPAFHTDMILQSIGEQSGFIAIFFIILLLGVLLRRTIVAGYRAVHPFLFYLTLGIAIVTAVQFVIISLGSTGMIPLTGVTVPFFSYGKVSMILTLVAFGVVLSVSKNRDGAKAANSGGALHQARQNMGSYNYSVSILSWIYSALAIFICGVFFYYQCIERDATLIRPVYVNNISGIPDVKYNPRIEQLSYKMDAGDIYDRNGVLLATSKKSRISQYSDLYERYNLVCDTLKRQQRYYPFGEHLYFMLGDFNSRLFFSISESNPRGYMAEAKHLSELRGYDNVLIEPTTGAPVKVSLSSDKYKVSKYYPADSLYEVSNVQLRDYEALTPYLKAGLNSEKIMRLNARKKNLVEWVANIFTPKKRRVDPKDMQLTIDALLQTDLQQKIANHVQSKFKGSQWNKLRVSAVILDASNGDLLASANYPLPDYDRLRTAPNSYSDRNVSKEWRAYTDMDLGLTYATAPGSTAKIVSSIAGFKSEGSAIASKNYLIESQEAIFTNSKGYPAEPIGDVDMQLALEKSSNCYFVNLVNDKELYDELSEIYGNIGAQIRVKSYALDYAQPSERWKREITRDERKYITAYQKYKESGKKEVMNQRSHKPYQWSWSWGQNGIDATPIAMARAASIAVNGGKMPYTKYILGAQSNSVEIMEAKDAEILSSFMKSTAAKHDGFKNPNIGGKTGTPERAMLKTINNDGWYVCFIEDAQISSKVGTKEIVQSSPIAIAVRLERINGKMSNLAVEVTKDVVIESLTELGYLNY